MENKLLLFQQEIGQIKQDLITENLRNDLDDEDSYKLATKIDLTVSRLLRLLECRHD
ncbi:MAG: hypothetical protein GXY86_05585 [Firmicutes bacterium]|nr:hypothetical protein [Bacillota bacterium]